MTINGVTFTEAAYKGKSEAEFIAHEKHHGFTDAELKKAYQLLTQPTKETKVEPKSAIQKD